MDAGQLKMTAQCSKLNGPPGATAARLPEVSILISLFGPSTLKLNPNLSFLFEKEQQEAKAAGLSSRRGPRQQPEDGEEKEADAQFLADQAERKAAARRQQRADDVFDSFFGASSRDVAQLPTCPQPKGDRHKLKTKLLKHQLQALRWMVQMEHPRPRE